MFDVLEGKADGVKLFLIKDANVLIKPLCARVTCES